MRTVPCPVSISLKNETKEYEDTSWSCVNLVKKWNKEYKKSSLSCVKLIKKLNKVLSSKSSFRLDLVKSQSSFSLDLIKEPSFHPPDSLVVKLSFPVGYVNGITPFTFVPI